MISIFIPLKIERTAYLSINLIKSIPSVNMWFITIKNSYYKETFLTTQIHIYVYDIETSCIVFKNPISKSPNHYCSNNCSPDTWEISPVQLIPMRKTLLDRGLNDDIIRVIMMFTYAKDLSDVPEEWLK